MVALLGPLSRNESRVMVASKHVLAGVLALGVALVRPVPGGLATPREPAPTGAQQARADGDGWGDFDFEIGTWKTHVERLKRPLTGSAIFVRFVITVITTDSCRFEQAFSDDGGKTWEVNWVATDTRVKE